ncbi:hypothetical protein [Leifsonia sp. NPDC080035]|uniref:Uncharacterized protein n=1 Tax=Leifsonia sp. NPDC080035 TaxID=3143936 RepID=A0AAU7GIU1_9MICO
MIVDDEQQDSARGFDPRYDPAFQRGYRPQPGERPRTRLRAATPSATASASAAGSAPEPRRDQRPFPARASDAGAQPAPVEAAALSIVPPPQSIPASFAQDVSAPAPAPAQVPQAFVSATAPGTSILDRLDLSPRRNPLMLALWIVAAGFVVLGIVLYSLSVSLSYSGATPSSDVGTLVVSQLGWMMAGPLITIGLATLVALLFLTALAGRRRPAVEEPPEDEGY